MGENHGTCEETGKQHGRIFRYRGSGMYEKCGSELERPYPSPKGKTVQENAVYGKVPYFIQVCREGKSERMSCRLITPKKKFDNFKTNYI